MEQSNGGTILSPTPSSKKTWPAVLIAVIVTAIIVGGLVYLWQKSAIKKPVTINPKFEQQKRDIIEYEAENKNIAPKVQEECVLEEEKYIVVNKSEMPQMYYPLDYIPTDDIEVFTEQEKEELMESVVTPYIEYMNKEGFEVVQIEIGSNSEVSLTMYTILYREATSQFYHYPVYVKKESGKVLPFDASNLGAPPGYQG